MPPSPATALDWLLLQRVSRSFYLTLRLLPDAVREPIALAYLLARHSDTEADGAKTEAERELLSRKDELLLWLDQSPDRAAIEQVWTTIRAGQRFDGERFAAADAPPLTEAELDRYTYLVAGCVGEFWTRLCAEKIPHFANRPIPEMLDLGIRFGKGLQLVNILRDRHADAQFGRTYLPPERLPAALQTARAHLDAAEAYTRAITVPRLRASCALPYLMGRETLDLVEATPSGERVKISRSRVWFLLLRALFLQGRARPHDIRTLQR